MKVNLGRADNTRTLSWSTYKSAAQRKLQESEHIALFGAAPPKAQPRIAWPSPPTSPRPDRISPRPDRISPRSSCLGADGGMRQPRLPPSQLQSARGPSRPKPRAVSIESVAELPRLPRQLVSEPPPGQYKVNPTVFSETDVLANKEQTKQVLLSKSPNSRSHSLPLQKAAVVKLPDISPANRRAASGKQTSWEMQKRVPVRWSAGE
eukprot:5952868-Pleurochrysis_carterae.AAC.3